MSYEILSDESYNTLVKKVIESCKTKIETIETDSLRYPEDCVRVAELLARTTRDNYETNCALEVTKATAYKTYRDMRASAAAKSTEALLQADILQDEGVQKALALVGKTKERLVLVENLNQAIVFGKRTVFTNFKNSMNTQIKAEQ